MAESSTKPCIVLPGLYGLLAPGLAFRWIRRIQLIQSLILINSDKKKTMDSARWFRWLKVQLLLFACCIGTLIAKKARVPESQIVTDFSQRNKCRSPRSPHLAKPCGCFMQLISYDIAYHREKTHFIMFPSFLWHDIGDGLWWVVMGCDALWFVVMRCDAVWDVVRLWKEAKEHGFNLAWTPPSSW